MKIIIYGSVFVFGIIGSYLPVWLFGAGMFDLVSIMGGIIGSFTGVFLGYKVAQYLDL